MVGFLLLWWVLQSTVTFHIKATLSKYYIKRANAQEELLELAVLVSNRASPIVLCQLQKSKASGLSTQESKDDKGSKCQDTLLQLFHLTEEAWSFAPTANASYPAPTEDKRTRQREGMLLGVIQRCTKCLGKGNVSVAFLLKTRQKGICSCNVQMSRLTWWHLITCAALSTCLPKIQPEVELFTSPSWMEVIPLIHCWHNSDPGPD